MAYWLSLLKSFPQLRWQMRFDMIAEDLVACEMSSQAFNQSKHWLLLDVEPVVLPPTPATIEFHNGVALARKQDRSTRGQVADV